MLTLPAQLPDPDTGCAWLRPLGSTPGWVHPHPTCQERKKVGPPTSAPAHICSQQKLLYNPDRTWHTAGLSAWLGLRVLVGLLGQPEFPSLTLAQASCLG